jgi:ketosteroid isomerase-like protein
MTTHPNFSRTQGSWDGVARGDFAAAIEQLADDVVIENGPGAGPWRHIEGRDAFLLMAAEFIPIFDGTWHQDGTCVYANDAMSIALVHETGTTPAGLVFDNRAVYVTRFRPDGVADRVWTVDLDTEAVEDFWSQHESAQT